MKIGNAESAAKCARDPLHLRRAAMNFLEPLFSFINSGRLRLPA